MQNLSRYPNASRVISERPPHIRKKSIVLCFGERLRTLRRAKGYTQMQLADYLGIDRSFISDVELGKKAMTLTYLETVAQGFEMTVSELVRDL